jgi:MSHA type pilus biogenesis protein MshL
MKLTLIAIVLGLSPQLPLALPAGPVAAAEAAPQEGLPELPAVQGEAEQRVGTAVFDVVMVNQELRPLLNLIAQQYGLNLVMPPDITGTVNADLRGVNLVEAIQIITEPLDLEFEIDGQLLRVRRPEMESRTFQFDYITTARQLSRSLSASASAGGGFAGTSSAGGTVGGGGGSSSTSITGSEDTSLLEDVQTDLESLTSEGGSVVFNRMAGLIFATDFPENLNRIGNDLELIESAVHRQVMIEAQILEVKLNDDQQAGIDWSAVTGDGGTLSQALGTGTGGLTYTVSAGSFNALFQALSQQGSVNVLSRPQVATLNNQPAVMRVGTQDIFFTTTTQVDPRTGTIIQTSETPSTINEGVVLDVTPQISDDGIITMNIHPTITERTGQASSSTGNTVPIVDVRETDVVVRVADGDTVVLAGLISDRLLENESSVPLLSAIPVLGHLFRRSEQEVRKTDMVILITPKIMTVRTAAEFARERLEQQDQLRDEVGGSVPDPR